MQKRFLQISPFWFDHPGGVEQYARVLQGLFPDEINTLAGGEDFPIIEPVKHFPFPAFWKPWFWKIFSDITKENTSYIISHIRFSGTTWFAFLLAKMRWIPYIHIEHGTGFLVHKNPLIAWVAKIVDLTIGRYIIRNAEKVITISEAGKKWVSETFWWKDIVVIYRGFEFPQIERKENEIPKIGFVGRLTGLKNVAWLLGALSELREEEWNLEIVWDGEERSNLEELMKKLWLTDRVSFLGARQHEWIMREFYPSVDIFVNPSLQEWLPTTVIEALGMGCQVIATDVGGTREIAGVHLIPAGSRESLEQTILDLLWIPTRTNAQNQFTLEVMRKNYAVILEIALSKEVI